MHRTECFYRIDRLLTERRGVTMAVLIDADGSYLLDHLAHVSHLRHGPEVEVLSPARLRTQVREQLAAALRRYAE